jgi:hypothetical protein
MHSIGKAMAIALQPDNQPVEPRRVKTDKERFINPPHFRLSMRMRSQAAACSAAGAGFPGYRALPLILK